VIGETLSLPARRPWWGALALLAMVALVVFVRLRLLQIPLERDEGEYAYSGQLMLEGIPPYQLAWNMKLPGTYAAYALIMAVFGQTIGGIHFGFLLANLGALALLFFIARRLTGFWGAVLACASYALLSLSPGVLGLAGHATHLVTLAALGGFLLLLRAREAGSAAALFWSGFCFGLAFLCKQPGLYFGMFGFCLVLRDGLRTRPLAWEQLLRKTGWFSAGILLPFALTCLIIWRLGTFERFWFWTFTYAKVHAGILTGQMAWAQFLVFLESSGSVKWSLPLAGAGWLCLLWEKDNADRKFILTTLLGFSLLGFAAAFYFSRHYFIIMLPVVSLLIAIAVTAAAQALAGARPAAVRLAPAALFVLGCAGFVYRHRAIWFQMTPPAVCQAVYGSNPFVESVEIARYIREHSAPDARVAILGSEPQIFFYARRRSASGFIYVYDLVQLHRYASQFQREMMGEIEAAKPRFLVLVMVSSSWLNWPGADGTLGDWGMAYIRRFYEQAGVVYIYPTHSDYIWGPESAPERSDTKYVVAVYQRKDTP
jgi:4-amino-4-deoxy-L-arabinose transferase-like glycosyltransferase